jgi:prophage tail gpP-like protein
VKTQYDSIERLAPATVTLTVNGKDVPHMRAEQSAPSVHSASETFDVGVDMGPAAALNYYDRAASRFDGIIEKTLCALMPLILGTNPT